MVDPLFLKVDSKDMSLYGRRKIIEVGGGGGGLDNIPINQQSKM